MDARVITAYEPSTSNKYLVNFGSVILTFYGRVCVGPVARWALPRFLV